MKKYDIQFIMQMERPLWNNTMACRKEAEAAVLKFGNPFHLEIKQLTELSNEDRKGLLNAFGDLMEKYNLG